MTIAVLTFNMEGHAVHPFELEVWDPKFELVVLCLQEVRQSKVPQEKQVDGITWELISDKYVRGLGKETLRSSSFTQKPWIGQALIIYKQKLIDVIVGQTVVSKFTLGKASIGTSAKIDNVDILFICSHFPFKQKEEDQGQAKRLAMAQKTYRVMQATFPTIENVIWAGDFNFRILFSQDTIDLLERWLESPEDAMGPVLKFLFEKDQLTEAKQDNSLQSFQEGVNNEGPLFGPTCKLKRNRSEACHTLTSVNNKDCFKLQGSAGWLKKTKTPRWPSWCDRILYKGVKCLAYERIDQRLPVKSQSDHASVLGVFTV